MTGSPTGTVLVVEDEDLVRRLVCTILARAGYEVVSASGADDAIALVNDRDGAVDVVLTDVVMAGMSGVHLVEQLAGRWPSVRAIYMSGYTNDSLGTHGVVDPATTFLQKPFGADVLLRAVESAVAA